VVRNQAWFAEDRQARRSSCPCRANRDSPAPRCKCVSLARCSDSRNAAATSSVFAAEVLRFSRSRRPGATRFAPPRLSAPFHRPRRAGRPPGWVPFSSVGVVCRCRSPDSRRARAPRPVRRAAWMRRRPESDGRLRRSFARSWVGVCRNGDYTAGIVGSGQLAAA